MDPDALIKTAMRLAKASQRRPRQSDLKRAVSTAYYALFHSIARNAADLLVGTGQVRFEPAWVHTYRALNHGTAKKACREVRQMGFPAEICACADAFVELQDARHEADYDPHHRVSLADALASVRRAEQAISDLKAADRRHRRAFAVQVLFQTRR